MNERRVTGVVVDAGHGGIGVSQKKGMITNANKYKERRYFSKKSVFFSDIIAFR